MNCCNNNKDENRLTDNQNNIPKSKYHNGHTKHMLHMALCCGLPILLILLLPALGYKGILLSIVPYICPIMMVLMIPMMFHKSKDDTKNVEQSDVKSLEEKRFS